LIEDLRIRTGLDIIKVEVGNIDFRRDVAYIKVYYNPKNGEVVSTTKLSPLRPEDF